MRKVLWVEDINDVSIMLGADDNEPDLEAMQIKIISSNNINLVAFYGDPACIPPAAGATAYYINIYASYNGEEIFVGIISRKDRNPTLDEMKDILAQWMEKDISELELNWTNRK